MARKDQPELQFNQPASLLTRALQGAGIGAMLIGFTFTLGMNKNPDNLSAILLPLFFVPAAGALGGMIYHCTDPWRAQGGSKKIIANFISGTAFLFLLTVAFILGMNGLQFSLTGISLFNL